MNTGSDSFYTLVLNIICIGVHHTILQILYSLMMAQLNPKIYSPFFSITNISFVQGFLLVFTTTTTGCVPVPVAARSKA